MSDGILLPELPRGILIPVEERVARLEEALAQIRSVLEAEHEAVAVQSTLACLLWQTLAQTNWCGFYRRTGEGMLTVGPFQGGMGCLRIPFERGVCGACARTGQTQQVPDVHAFAGHIACDDATRSELVIPVRDAQGRLQAVLDLDSPHLDAFSTEEARRLEALLDGLFKDPRMVW
jgi:GAF domain-containing protein